MTEIDQKIAAFKKSIANRQVTPTSNTDFVIEILIPFYVYCKSTARRIEEFFSEVRGSLSINTLGINGKIENFYSSSNELSVSGEEKFLHDNIASMNSTIYIIFANFQGLEDINKSFRIENIFSSQECRWVFSYSEKGVVKECDEKDLNKLKEIFNSIFEQMMLDLTSEK